MTLDEIEAEIASVESGMAGNLPAAIRTMNATCTYLKTFPWEPPHNERAHDLYERADAFIRVETVDHLLEGFSDGFLRGCLEKADTRRKRAGVAGNIAADRYGAGSNGARASLFIHLVYGLEAAKEFILDLENNEE